MLRSVAAWTVAVLLVLGLAHSARATVETRSGYTKAQTYNAALRYLRVDLGYEVTEKDATAAYLLFKFAAEGRKAPANGSIEIVEQRDGVRLYVHLPEMPRYHEEMLSDGLVRKLRDEYGEPPRHEEPAPPRTKRGEGPDAGT
jgi:hypothetical protein